MKEFIKFTDKVLLDFKKIVTSGACPDRYRNNLNSFLKYVNKDFRDKHNKCITTIDGFEDSVKLEYLIDTKYRFLFKNQDLNSAQNFINTFVNRMDDFRGNENSMKILLGFYTLYFVVLVKLADVYMESALAYNSVGQDIIGIPLTLSDVGIDNEVLKFYKLFETLREKDIDEWISINPSAGEEKYMSSAIKRILLIFGY